MDNMTKLQRSTTMSRIQSKETKPERMLRSILHREGYRFRKNVTSMPGTPDIVLSKYKTAIFVHGCFWHQHPKCLRASEPKTNRNYWTKKLGKNIKRDREYTRTLTEDGWSVVVVWECEIKQDIEEVFHKINEVLNEQVMLPVRFT